MRTLLIACIISLLGGCAFPGTVQRVGVEYNTAIAGMANELTLLNILRAKEDLPLHYTAVSRLTGSLTVRTGGSINAVLKGDATTLTDQTLTTDQSVRTDQTLTTTPPGTPATATTSAVPGQPTTAVTGSDVITAARAITAARQMVPGVTVTTPALSGEINTGPSFDIAVLDTQKFYNGILAAIPFSTIENYIGQGFPDQLLMRLLIERIDFKNKDGDVLHSWQNTATSKRFAKNLAHYNLVGRAVRKDPENLSPVSRLRNYEAKPAVSLSLQELALLDGKTLQLSAPLPVDAARDNEIMVQKTFAERRVAELVPKDPALRNVQRRPPNYPPADPLFLGKGKALVFDEVKKTDVEADVEIVFRSPESVIRFLGAYLQAGTKAVPLEGKPLFFVVEGKPANALVTTEILGKKFSIADDGLPRRNMKVIAIIQQLVNLHKESTDRPVTVPVQVVGG